MKPTVEIRVTNEEYKTWLALEGLLDTVFKRLKEQNVDASWSDVIDALGFPNFAFGNDVTGWFKIKVRD